MQPETTWSGFTVPDPLTESGVRRLDMAGGTLVRLHIEGEYYLDVPLLGIRNVTTFQELSDRVTHDLPIIVESPRRVSFAGGAVRWCEDVTE